MSTLAAYANLPARRPWRVVTPLGSKWLGDLDADPLRMWTTQTADAYAVLSAAGVLRGDPRLACRDFTNAYAWMQSEADSRLSTRGPGLLWLFARTTRKEIRRGARLQRGEVLLEVEVPRDRVLVSGFDLWHAVLNSALIVPTLGRESDDDWWARAEPLMDAFDARLRAAGLTAAERRAVPTWPVALRRGIEESWTNIFDDSQWGRDEHVQAVVHEIRAEHVVSAHRIM